MKYLIGDIGNTSTKICILSRKFQILRSYNFDTNKMYKNNLLNRIIRKKNNKDMNPIFLFSSIVIQFYLHSSFLCFPFTFQLITQKVFSFLILILILLQLLLLLFVSFVPVFFVCLLVLIRIIFWLLIVLSLVFRLFCHPLS